MSFPHEAVPDGSFMVAHHFVYPLFLVLVLAFHMSARDGDRTPIATVAASGLGLYGWFFIWPNHPALGATICLVTPLALIVSVLALETHATRRWRAIVALLGLASFDDAVEHSFPIPTPLDTLWEEVGYDAVDGLTPVLEHLLDPSYFMRSTEHLLQALFILGVFFGSILLFLSILTVPLSSSDDSSNGDDSDDTDDGTESSDDAEDGCECESDSDGCGISPSLLLFAYAFCPDRVSESPRCCSSDDTADEDSSEDESSDSEESDQDEETGADSDADENDGDAADDGDDGVEDTDDTEDGDDAEGGDVAEDPEPSGDDSSEDETSEDDPSEENSEEDDPSGDVPSEDEPSEDDSSEADSSEDDTEDSGASEDSEPDCSETPSDDGAEVPSETRGEVGKVRLADDADDRRRVGTLGRSDASDDSDECDGSDGPDDPDGGSSVPDLGRGDLISGRM